MNHLTSRIGVEHPIVQGPFGGGNSTPQLAAAVSNLGGLGSYGAHNLAPDAIGTVVREIRALTAKPFAINLWVSDHDAGGLDVDAVTFARTCDLFEPYFRELGVERPSPPARFHHGFAAQVEALLKAAPPVFSFVFGLPSPAILAEFRRRGIATIGAATTIAEAEALDAAGLDCIVATGFEAGGHRPSFLARAEDSLNGTLALVPLVAQRVKAPVIAAGGIVDARGVRAALALGAQAAQLGTAFLACDESGASAPHRAALFSEKARHTVLTRAYSGRLARGISNRLALELSVRASELLAFPAQGWFVAQLKDAAIRAGRDDLLALYAGQGAPGLRHRTVRDLMDSLLNEGDPR